MRQVIPDIYDTFTEEGGPGTVAVEVFEHFIWVTTGVIYNKSVKVNEDGVTPLNRQQTLTDC